MVGKGIYLREKDVYVGPFYSREDAERFLVLIELSGGSLKACRRSGRSGGSTSHPDLLFTNAREDE